VDLEERIKIQRENEEKLAAWEAERKAEAERRERQEKQDRLKDYLARRTEAWADHTGSTPSSGKLAKWREEYVERLIADQELDLELRRARAATESPW
jgi:hypothetical protein